MDGTTIAITVIGAVTSNLLTFLLTKRIGNARAQKSELENVEKAIGIWHRQSIFLEQKVTELSEQLHKVKEDNENLRVEMIRIHARNKEFKQQLEECRKNHA